MVASTRRETVARVLEGLRASENPERREKTRGYFPTSMEIIGVAAPDQRRILRPLARALRGAPAGEVLALARALLDTRVHEARQIAFELVGGRRDIVASLDGAAVEALGEGNDNWASVDAFCVSVAGQAWRDGAVVDADVRRWAASPDRWWRRTALVSTVPLNMKSRGGSGDAARTLTVCRILAGDTDPMVAKGLSWALRSLVPVDADAVAEFLRAHGETVPALVRREVRNKLETGRKSGRTG